MIFPISYDQTCFRVSSFFQISHYYCTIIQEHLRNWCDQLTNRRGQRFAAHRLMALISSLFLAWLDIRIISPNLLNMNKLHCSLSAPVYYSQSRPKWIKFLIPAISLLISSSIMGKIKRSKKIHCVIFSIIQPKLTSVNGIMHINSHTTGSNSGGIKGAAV